MDADADPGEAAAEKPPGWAAARQAIETGRYWVSPAGRRPRWRQKLFRCALFAFVAAMRLTGLYGRGRRNALAPRLVELELQFDTLPQAFDGYRILHLSDTHLDMAPELAGIAGAMLAGLAVDTLVLTGDILGAHDAPLHTAVEPLVPLIERVAVRDRRFAVLGNHDPAAMADALERIGFTVLLNRSTTVERHSEHVVWTGLDDVHYFYTDAARAALDRPGIEGFRIALVHSPELADAAAAAGVALYLCGHTHGGQVCLPGGTPLVTQLTRCRHAGRGLWRHGATTGYTSSGLGTGWPTLRYGCPGEMTLITLRRRP
ncbi:MAG: metallophosphoesterase family protein [Alphaproteobacteria bacterium]|nr:metallophosphoesterase family protein [Alphaproteobacteria bacterium]